MLKKDDLDVRYKYLVATLMVAQVALHIQNDFLFFFYLLILYLLQLKKIVIFHAY